MLLFTLIFVTGLGLVYLLQKMDVECVNPPKPRKRPAPARQGYALPPSSATPMGGTHRHPALTR
jgi:hypothetical protein